MRNQLYCVYLRKQVDFLLCHPHNLHGMWKGVFQSMFNTIYIYIYIYIEIKLIKHDTFLEKWNNISVCSTSTQYVLLHPSTRNMYTCSQKKKKNRKSCYDAYRSFLRWWLCSHAYFWTRRIIRSHQERPSSTISYHSCWFPITLRKCKIRVFAGRVILFRIHNFPANINDPSNEDLVY